MANQQFGRQTVPAAQYLSQTTFHMFGLQYLKLNEARNLFGSVAMIGLDIHVYYTYVHIWLLEHIWDPICGKLGNQVWKFFFCFTFILSSLENEAKLIRWMCLTVGLPSFILGIQ